jgi:hypothetical protein
MLDVPSSLKGADKDLHYEVIEREWEKKLTKIPIKYYSGVWTIQQQIQFFMLQ